MKPVGALQKNGQMYIMHQCIRCGFERNNSLGKEDNFDALLAIKNRGGRSVCSIGSTPTGYVGVEPLELVYLFLCFLLKRQ